jgi:CRISPR-associated protein (TIGR03986 family)
MSNPKHLPNGRKREAAIAPYNFVELPEQPVHAQDEHQPVLHDRYHSNRKTGRIVCTLTTASPLYVRCALTTEQFAKGEDERQHPPPDWRDAVKHTPDFFYLHNREQPVIPGSSLRGMLRSLVEIAAFGKIARVTKNKPFFRTLTDSSTRDIYNNFFVVRHGRVRHRPNPSANCYGTYARTGFLVQRSSGEFTIKECESGRIKRSDIPGSSGRLADLYDLPATTPKWKYQHKSIYVQIDPEADHFFPAPPVPPGKRNPRHPDMYLRYRAVSQASSHPASGLEEGVLVLTGHMQHKKLEFVFLKQTGQEYPVSNAMVRRFHDDDQITQWQEKAFPKDRPQAQCRDRNGMLRDGEPVFFLLNDDQTVRFFGRAQNFRLPYPHSPHDFIPDALKSPDTVDLAEAIFGFVRDEKQKDDNQQSRAGRVFVGDATLDDPQQREVWLRDKPLIPRILATPKPTTFQHYLVQPEDDKQKLRHYASKVGGEDGTLIRGHKLYWHQGDVDAAHIEDEDFPKKPAEDQRSDTQHTQFRPVRSGVSFTFTIHFENLTDVELGALLWVLRVAADPARRLKLGMGKPLGMGAVQIIPQLVLNDRCARYRALFDGDGWASGDLPASSDGEQEEFVQAFRAYVQQQAGLSSFEESPRIKMLRAMLAWPGPDKGQTRYMEIEYQGNHPIGSDKGDKNEYKQRFVLPSPLDADADHRDMGKQSQPNITHESDLLNPRIPGVGDVFTGKILEQSKHGVKIELPESFTDPQDRTISIPKSTRSSGKVIGLIRSNLLGKSQYRVGNSRRVRVVKVLDVEEITILELEPAPRNKK